MSRTPLLFVLLAACGASVDPEASSLVADSLCTRLDELGTRCTIAPGKPVFTAEGHEVKVTAYVDDMLNMPGKSVATMRYEIAVDGAKLLSSNEMKDGATAAKAVKAATTRWSDLHARAVASALATTWNKPPAGAQAPIEVGGRRAHRGEILQAGGNTEADPAGLLLTLEPLVSQLPAGGVHMYELTMQVEGGKPTHNSQCFVDGALSSELCRQAAGYPWPDGSYMARQVYVFTP